MSFSRISTALLVVLLASVAMAQILEVPMDKGWGPCPEWTGGEHAERHNNTFQDGYASLTAEGAGRPMIWLNYPKPRLDVKPMRFVSLRYRATNIDPTLFSYLLYMDTGDSGGMFARNLILSASDLVQDGPCHTPPAQTTSVPNDQRWGGGERGIIWGLRNRAKGRLVTGTGTRNAGPVIAAQNSPKKPARSPASGNRSVAAVAHGRYREKNRTEKSTAPTASHFISSDRRT